MGLFLWGFFGVGEAAQPQNHLMVWDWDKLGPEDGRHWSCSMLGIQGMEGFGVTHLQMMMKNLRSSRAWPSPVPLSPSRVPRATLCPSLWLSTCSTSGGSAGISEPGSSGLGGIGVQDVTPPCPHGPPKPRPRHRMVPTTESG